MPKKTLAQSLEDCKNDRWTSSDPVENEAVEGHSIYPRDKTNRSRCPVFVTDKLPVPFELSLGKNKKLSDVTEWTRWNMELSVREHNETEIAYGAAIDDYVFNTVCKHGDECFGKGVTEAEIKVLQRRCLAPKKEFKRNPKPPYSWRFKVHPKSTAFWRVVGTNADGTERVKRVGMRAIKKWSQVRVIGEFSGIYVSPQSFGPNFSAESVLIYDAEPRDKEEKEDEDENGFGFGGFGNFTVTTEAEEAANGAGEGAAAGEGGGEGEDEGEGTGAEPAAEDDHTTKRTRTRGPDTTEDPYSDDDDN